MKPYLEFSEVISDGKSPQKAYERLGKVTTQSVFKCTGKHWKQWVSLLDRAGARTWTHREIVEYLKKKHKLTPWWQQGVTSGYELAIGRRQEGQDAKGKYMVTSTKSLSCKVQKVWDLLTSSQGIDLWLKPLAPLTIKPGSTFETKDGFFGEIRTLKKNRRLRLFWQDPLWEFKTTVELMLVSRPADKSILVFNHTGIQNTQTQTLLRKRWKSVVEELAKIANH